jgi:hypothetical protein
LARQGKFEEAESLMLEETAKETGYGYELIARAAFYEDWGARADSKEKAKEYYEKALDGFWQFAAGATSGGEGTARMIDVKRLQKKLAEFV